MSKALDFGVQSFCFRETKDNVEVAKMIQEIGLDKLEICAIHANFHDLTAFKEVAKIYADAGVSIISFGVETLTGEANERELFECAAIAGAKHMSVHFKIDSFPDAIAKTQKLSDEFGVRVGVHCHGGYMFGGSPDVLDYLIKLGAPQIGICIDTAWCMQIGPHAGKPIEWAKRYAGHIYGIHYKDFKFNPNGEWVDTIVGEGNLDLPAFIQALDGNGFDGMTVIEYEGDATNPVPALKNCVKAMRSSASAS